jgi:hypothetical protein
VDPFRTAIRTWGERLRFAAAALTGRLAELEVRRIGSDERSVETRRYVALERRG